MLWEKGKDAVIRRENKTKRRTKKAALDGGKDSEYYKIRYIRLLYRG